MTPTTLEKLEPGTIYNVRHNGGKRAVRRVFKWIEKRFGSIPCAVFTTKVVGPLKVEVISPEHFRFTGGPKAVPTNELSIPAYDLISCEPTLY